MNFKEKHPSCGFLTCCVIKKGLEVCSACVDYPCKRFEPERDGYDSFVTHKKVFTNLDFIKNNTIECFIGLQEKRMIVLKDFLENYDDGRSKSLFCISCSLLPLDKLEETQRSLESRKDLSDIREKNNLLKDRLKMIAETLKTDLKLNNKK